MMQRSRKYSDIACQKHIRFWDLKQPRKKNRNSNHEARNKHE